MRRPNCKMILICLFVFILSYGDTIGAVTVSGLTSLSAKDTEVEITDSLLVTLTKSMLSKVPAVTKLEFSDNRNFKNIESDAFSVTTKLQELNIFATNELGEFPNLSGLNDLTKVLIQHSQIAFIPDDYITNLPVLIELDLSYNQFIHFPIEIGLIPWLNKLILNNNNIEYVNVSGLRNNIPLNELQITSNNMKTFPAITAFPNLMGLYLSNNQIESAPWSEALSAYHPTMTEHNKLDALFLDSNPLSSAGDFSLFKNLPQLGYIIMNSCNLTAIPYTLSHAPRLRGMYFQYNSISWLPANIVTASSKIEEIHLTGNLLISLPYVAFNDMDDLEVLDIRDNKFTTLSSQILHESRIFNVDMTGNPLVCDRSLCWIKEHDPVSSGQAFALTLGSTPCTNLAAEAFSHVTATTLGCTGPLTLAGNTASANVFVKKQSNNNGNLFSLSTLQKHGSSLVQNTNFVDSPSCSLGCLIHGSECTGFAIEADQKKCWLLIQG